jgi:hypothetical protein
MDGNGPVIKKKLINNASPIKNQLGEALKSSLINIAKKQSLTTIEKLFANSQRPGAKL